MPTSLVPPGMTRLPRFVLHPYGKGQLGVTLALYGAGFGVVAYRLYVNGKVLFAGTAQSRSEDWVDVASKILAELTVRPGDAEDETTSEYAPEQLSFVLEHGPAVRAEAARRFGWQDKAAKLRADLEPIYSYRRDLGGKRRHRFQVGAVAAEASTRASAKSGIRAAVLNQCSALPTFKVMPDRTLAMYPAGSEWRAQELLPGRLGDAHVLPAKTQAEAQAALEALTQTTPLRQRRPSIRAIQLAI